MKPLGSGSFSTDSLSCCSATVSEASCMHKHDLANGIKTFKASVTYSDTHASVPSKSLLKEMNTDEPSD